MIGFLEYLVGADFGILQQLEFIHRQGGHVDIYAPNFAAALMHAVDRLDRLEHIGESLARIGFAGDHQDALMALFDDDSRFLGDLLLTQGAAVNLLIAGAECAVQALIGAQVRDVERGEHDQPLAVDLFLDLAGGGKEFAHELGVADRGQHGHVGKIQALHLKRLGEYVLDLFHVGVCETGECLFNDGFVDRYGGRWIVHDGSCEIG
jgi:hypothetical protein